MSPGSISFSPNGKFSLYKGCTFCDMIRHSSEAYAEYDREKSMDLSTGNYPELAINIALEGKSVCFSISVSQKLFIRVYDPVNVPGFVQTDIQWTLVNNWLVECTEKHDKCSSEYLKQPDGILLIDVQQRKLVGKDENCRFVALSYIWGANPNPERLICTKSNFQSLKKDGVLKAEKLPRTIEDALQVCKNLGQSYLWVDRLCIVQDDASQKHDQIEAMAKIYASAFLVIVVLDGDMETGIPGIQPRPTQKRVEIAGLVYMSELPHPAGLIEQSDWATRGWTYQEAVLARRKLYFSHVQVFLECNTHRRDEDPVKQAKPESQRGGFPRPILTEIGWTLDDWQYHLWEYTARSLSYPSDIYNAIAGVSNVLLPEPDSWLYGSPRRSFDEALLWLNTLEEGYRSSEKTLLPRWSWSSVNGQTGHKLAWFFAWDGDEQPEYAGTSVVWKYQEENCSFPNFVPVRDRRFVASFRAEAKKLEDWVDFTDEKVYGLAENTSTTRLLCFAIAWSQGCIDAEWPFPALTQSTFPELHRKLEKWWQTVRRLEIDFLLLVVLEQPTPLTEIEKSLHRSTLKGRAQTSFFALKEAGTMEKTADMYTIIDNDARPVGKLHKIDEVKAEVGLTFSPSCMYQFVALSIGYFELPYFGLSALNDLFADGPEHHLWKRARSWFDHANKTQWSDYNLEEEERFCKAVGPGGLDI